MMLPDTHFCDIIYSRDCVVKHSLFSYIRRVIDMVMKPCARCGELIQYGPIYCSKCKPIVMAQVEEAIAKKQAYKRAKYNKKYNSNRDPKYGAFYRSKEWKMTSREKLRSTGFKCEAKLEDCTHIAVEVHHVKPLKTEEGWNERLEWSGLRSVCMNCHNKLDGKNFRRRKDPNVLDLKEIMAQPRGVV